MVGGGFHDHFDYLVNLCIPAKRTEFGVARPQVSASEDPASADSVNTPDSAEVKVSFHSDLCGSSRRAPPLEALSIFFAQHLYKNSFGKRDAFPRTRALRRNLQIPL